MKRLTEDEKLLKAIRENKIRQRELNIKRVKEYKRKQFINTILGSAFTIGFIAALGFLMSVVEHMSF